MDQLRIADHYEWWITFEDGYGAHCIVRKVFSEEAARGLLGSLRARADHLRKERYEVQRVLVHSTAEKLDW